VATLELDEKGARRERRKKNVKRRSSLASEIKLTIHSFLFSFRTKTPRGEREQPRASFLGLYSLL